MNKRQKEIIQSQLNSEKAVLQQLQEVYKDSLEKIGEKIKILQVDEMMQSKVYQKEHQEVLKAQIAAILDNMNANQYTTVEEYLKACYKDGYIGVMYDIHGQGIPVIVPINQEAAVKAIQTDSKISGTMYKAMGKDVGQLKRQIAQEATRGVASSLAYAEIARNLRNVAGVGIRNTMRIARTEGHRIQEAAKHDSQIAAREKGADVVKQWNSVLDGGTRPEHQQLDGQIRELEEPFEVNGMTAMYPGAFGRAEQDINCRCTSTQRAKWALDESELETLKERAEYFGLDKAKDFDDFKEKYLNAEKDLNNLTKGSTILSEKDTKAIYDYMSAKSYVVNDKLRRGEKLTKTEEVFVNNLDAALDKMPTYKGNLQRSLLFYSDDDVNEFLQNYEIGKPIVYNEYLSTTKGETYNPEGQVQICIQDAKNGKDISSINENENEILYKRKASFKVENMVNQDGKYYILVVENNAE